MKGVESPLKMSEPAGWVSSDQEKVAEPRAPRPVDKR